jgi:hypothetical protein
MDLPYWRTLMLTTLERVDILYALQNGKPPAFSRDCFSQALDSLANHGIAFHNAVVLGMAQSEKLDPLLRNVLRDASHFAALLNKDPINLKIDPDTFHEIVVSLSYRLLHFRQLRGYTFATHEDDAYHLGLLMFVMTVFLQFDPSRILYFESVSLSLKLIVDNCLKSGDRDVALWVLFMGGIWTSGDPDGGEWLLQRTQTYMRNAQVHTWAEVYSSVSKFPWINVLHNNPSRVLWSRISKCL